MKKLFAVLIGVALIVAAVSPVFAAQATVTATEYGYSITGGTDETMVAVDLIRVKMITYTALTANNVCALRSGAVSGTTWYMKATGVSNAAGCSIYFGEYGALFSCLSVKLAEAQDIVMIYNK